MIFFIVVISMLAALSLSAPVNSGVNTIIVQDVEIVDRSSDASASTVVERTTVAEPFRA
ncbi:hypothetical protein ANO14919_102900 [Xylariales sp. No.14919]|nr:hypothetical protein ANO14919_102900 [Xylariales sp. No.14919]